ncbi:cell wall hydrolase [Paenibacillus sp. BR2-3]|uniref:cell wall hydrolase n=1 Tax=Paenibacillus sp. BR2-3 TaxID=3048494 RepID=UPI003977A36D
MLIFKQSRCIALLVGVILVCFSAISLLYPGGITEGGQNRMQMVKLQSSGLSADLPLTLKEDTDPKRTQSTLLSKRAAVAPKLNPSWKSEGEAAWISIWDLIDQSKPVTSGIPVKAAAVTSPPAAQKALHKGEATVSQQYPPTTLFFSRTELLSQEQQSNATWRYAVSEEDMLLLQKVVMAEAEGEPYQGKVAVANVVLNRLRSANFPDTIKDVIYQKSQFSPVANGRLKRVKPNQDSINAVKAALSGEKEVTDDTYFFLSLKLAEDLTVHHSQEYAKTIGNHTFYK